MDIASTAPDLANVYLHAFITVGSAILGIWGLVIVIKNIKSTNDKEVLWRQKVNAAVQKVEDNTLKWDKGLADTCAERDKIVTRFDLELKDLKNVVDENHTDSESKVQQLTSMVLLLMKSMYALLDREIKQGANGEVMRMYEELKDFIFDGNMNAHL